MIRPIVRVVNLGRLSYGDAFKAQCTARDKLIEQLKSISSTSAVPSSPVATINSTSAIGVDQFENKLLLVEHDPVFTVGIRRTDYDETLTSKLRSLGADFVVTDRGGLITFHGHGQLTIYPILYLGCFFANRSIRCYVNRLEDTVIEALKMVLPPNRKVSTISEYPGVWIEDERKIAAIGVHGKRYVTTHGTCLNCDNDLTWFDHIIPCGIPDKSVTSVTKEIGTSFTIDQAIPLLLQSFSQQFNCDLVWADHHVNS